MTDSQTATSHWKLISFLLAGILIPLAAAAVPWLLERIAPGDNLTYTFIGPIESASGVAVAVAITVTNEGRTPQTNVEVWVPLRLNPAIETRTKRDGSIDLVETKQQVIFEASSPYTSVKEDGDHHVVKFASLRPKEAIDISAFVVGKHAHIYEYELERLRIVSDSAVAVNTKPSDEEFLFYRAGTWLFIFLFALGFFWSLYYEFLMPFAKKEKYLLDQIDKLGKKK